MLVLSCLVYSHFVKTPFVPKFCISSFVVRVAAISIGLITGFNVFPLNPRKYTGVFVFVSDNSAVISCTDTSGNIDESAID